MLCVMGIGRHVPAHQPLKVSFYLQVLAQVLDLLGAGEPGGCRFMGLRGWGGFEPAEGCPHHGAQGHYKHCECGSLL